MPVRMAAPSGDVGSGSGDPCRAESRQRTNKGGRMIEAIANENPGLMDASAGVKLVSGFGQYHTNRDREIHGRFYPGKPYSGITLAEIFEMAKNPPSVPKAQAQWVIFSSLPSRVHA